MVVSPNEYRWDFLGLSTDAKPTSETSENVTNGSTYYEVDTSKLYVYYGDTWYEKVGSGGGGGTSDIVKTEVHLNENTGELSTELTCGEIKQLITEGKLFMPYVVLANGTIIEAGVASMLMFDHGGMFNVYFYDISSKQFIVIPLMADRDTDTFKGSYV